MDGELAVVALYSIDVGRSRTLRAELAVVGPAHRRLNLSNHLTPLWVLLARAVGAETILGWATLTHPYVQLGCERQGLELVGIFPAAERQVGADGAARHLFEALYIASLVPPELRRCPPGAAMPERTAALARFVLGERVR